MLCCAVLWPAPLPPSHPSAHPERIKFLEVELKQHRQQLASMTSERDSLQEDIWQIKAAKKQSDEVGSCGSGVTFYCVPSLTPPSLKLAPIG